MEKGETEREREREKGEREKEIFVSLLSNRLICPIK